MRKGLIQIYTGDGKGKSTAAVGQAVRALGHGMRVCYIYFHKKPEGCGYGEIRSLENLGADIFGFAKFHPFCDKDVTFDRIRSECLEGLNFVEGIFRQKRYDLLVLDEINISLRDHFVKEEEILCLLEKRPENLEIVMTGRDAPKTLIQKADLVSRIIKIKHPFDHGVKARKGIEY
jgi:cob(I)alamin adenosyltransferase